MLDQKERKKTEQIYFHVLLALVILKEKSPVQCSATKNPYNEEKLKHHLAKKNAWHKYRDNLVYNFHNFQAFWWKMCHISNSIIMLNVRHFFYGHITWTGRIDVNSVTKTVSALEMCQWEVVWVWPSLTLAHTSLRSELLHGTSMRTSDIRFCST